MERFGTSVAAGCSTSAAFSLLFLFEFLITSYGRRNIKNKREIQ